MTKLERNIIKHLVDAVVRHQKGLCIDISGAVQPVDLVLIESALKDICNKAKAKGMFPKDKDVIIDIVDGTELHACVSTN